MRAHFAARGAGTIIAGLAALVMLMAGAALAKPPAAIAELLTRASDGALDKLSQPGAFSADDAIRIALPGAGKLGGLMGMSDKLGVTKDLNKSLNSAAEMAAGKAKPIFRDAIHGMTIEDTASVLTGGDTAATEYLEKSSGERIIGEIRPLVADALEKAGAFKQVKSLQKLGLTEDKLTDHVADRTAAGIFKYMGAEETRLRENPIGGLKSLLKDWRR